MTTPTTSVRIKSEIAAWEAAEAKFAGGKKSASTDARKALAELMKLAKQRRAEITTEKEALAAAK